MKIAINGFGRIGRCVFRAYLKRIANGEKDIEIVAVNNPLKKGQKISDFIHMLEFDSVHGRLHADITVSDDHFIINGMKVLFYSQIDPAMIPWSDCLVDVVVDSTGVFKDMTGLGKHLKGTVKKVMMSAPGDNLDGTFVMGVNDNEYDKSKHHIVSNASCTTNCLAPIVKVLNDNFGVSHGMIVTVHSATNDQRVLDLEHEDLRRARSSLLNLIPTKTGAAKAVGEVLPELKGKLDGYAIRVPTADVSVVDFCVILNKSTTKEEVNALFTKASQNELKGILDVSNKELVSTDFIGDSHSSIIDSKYTQVINGTMLKVMSWYDNEMGYSNRVLDLAKKLL